MGETGGAVYYNQLAEMYLYKRVNGRTMYTTCWLEAVIALLAYKFTTFQITQIHGQSER